MGFIRNWLLLLGWKQGVLPVLGCGANGLHAGYEGR